MSDGAPGGSCVHNIEQFSQHITILISQLGCSFNVFPSENDGLN